MRTQCVNGEKPKTIKRALSEEERIKASQIVKEYWQRRKDHHKVKDVVDNRSPQMATTQASKQGTKMIKMMKKAYYFHVLLRKHNKCRCTIMSFAN